jgi:hypothetical protein
LFFSRSSSTSEGSFTDGSWIIRQSPICDDTYSKS